MSEFETRFGGIRRLFSTEGLGRLRRAHVAVIGVGGVGSWSAEALARSGVGHLTLVDLDDVCATNVNRQLPALDPEIGKSKIDVMARRIQAINPECSVGRQCLFFTASTADAILSANFDYVLDAIDQVTNKCLLIARCRERNIPVITVGGAGGRQDPTAVRIGDLSQTSHDPLLQQVRKRLRAEYGFPRNEKPFGVPCVFSTERQIYPHSDGTVCAEREEGGELRLDCNSGYGTASFVTGAFGFAAAAQVVRTLAGRDGIPSEI